MKNLNVSVDSISVNSLLFSTTCRTKKLLEEKQFCNSLINSRNKKTVLLATEISELADAVKKGEGLLRESEELADIIIRSCNFLCAIETFDIYRDTLLNCEDLKKKEIIVNLSSDFFRSTNSINSKFEILENMLKTWGLILNSCVVFLENRNRENFIDMWEKIAKLNAYCKIYCNEFIKMDLREIVESKMNKNLSRKIRYNCCEEFN